MFFFTFSTTDVGRRRRPNPAILPLTPPAGRSNCRFRLLYALLFSRFSFGRDRSGNSRIRNMERFFYRIFVLGDREHGGESTSFSVAATFFLSLFSQETGDHRVCLTFLPEFALSCFRLSPINCCFLKRILLN